MKQKTRPARNALGGLNCQVPGCKTTIRAMTGLQEISRLQRHYERAHVARISMHDALEIRAQWEAKGHE